MTVQLEILLSFIGSHYQQCAEWKVLLQNYTVSIGLEILLFSVAPIMWFNCEVAFPGSGGQKFKGLTVSRVYLLRQDSV